MKGLVWLASYPRSGNTWFRTFLTNYLENGDAPADINRLHDGPMSSYRETFDRAIGFASSELTFDEIDRLRPEVYRLQARRTVETLFCKIHDAYTFLPDGRAMIPADATAAALYFVRNPLDVAVSLAHHVGGAEFDLAIRKMGDPHHAVGAEGTSQLFQLRQKLLTWSGHVTSWADAPGVRVQVVRYEDMKQQPEATFRAAVNFIGLADDPGRVQRAIQFSRFEELQRQERVHGFGEKLLRAEAFFRKGEIGSWRMTLTPAQADRIVSQHADVMRRFGYLDAQDRPVF